MHPKHGEAIDLGLKTQNMRMVFSSWELCSFAKEWLGRLNTTCKLCNGSMMPDNSRSTNKSEDWWPTGPVPSCNGIQGLRSCDLFWKPQWLNLYKFFGPPSRLYNIHIYIYWRTIGSGGIFSLWTVLPSDYRQANFSVKVRQRLRLEQAASLLLGSGRCLQLRCSRDSPPWKHLISNVCSSH